MLPEKSDKSQILFPNIASLFQEKADLAEKERICSGQYP